MRRTPIEPDEVFNARIDAENAEAKTVPCPLETCGAEIGESCSTEAGEARIRHCRRLMLARKQNGTP
jgi:hypothetical protein